MFFLIPLVVINLHPLKVNLIFYKSSLHIKNRLCYKCSFVSQLLGSHLCPEMLAGGVRQLFEPLAEAMRGAGAEKPELRLGARIEQCSPASWVR